MTLAVFGMISYYTFAEDIHQTSDRLVILQSNNIIYQLTKLLDKKVSLVERQISDYLQGKACSLDSSEEQNRIFQDLAHQNPPFRSIAIQYVGHKGLPSEFQTWMDEIGNSTSEPILRRQSEDLFLLWPTQTPTGPAVILFTLDQNQISTTLRSYLNIEGSSITLSNGNTPLITPVQQNPLKPLPTETINRLLTVIPGDDVDKSGTAYTYRSPDTLFGADVGLAVPMEFYQKNLISLKNRTIAAMLIVGWISIWILLIIAFKISSPVRQLSKITKDIIAFNYTTDLEIPPSDDEIGELAQNFETMRDKIKNLVTKDPLTHVYNRRFMMHIFELAVLKAIRYQTKLCCIMMDIDHFKKINDTYGHQGGDAVLVAVGKTLAHVSRDYDTPARYGGEEFMLILPDTVLSDAIEVAERIRTSIKSMIIPFENIEIRCTMSLGVAELDLYEVNTTDQLIRCADTALYQAKKTGRDRVVASPPTTHEPPPPQES